MLTKNDTKVCGAVNPTFARHTCTRMAGHDGEHYDSTTQWRDAKGSDMLTENEIVVLKAVCRNDYLDGAHPLGNPQWIIENPFPSKKTFSGVCGSLVKKGFLLVWDEGTRDHSQEITEEGFEALRAADPEFCEKIDKCPRW